MTNVLTKKLFYVVSILVLSSILLVGCGSSDSERSMMNNPFIEDVRDAISSIDHINLIEIATEDNDPNGKLGKQGGYTGALFFLYALVEGTTEESALEAGTDGGGCIEVYANIKDAQNRDDYLGIFDGSILDSGSHMVFGTLVIRTSSKLTASQQSALETAIINALTTE